MTPGLALDSGEFVPAAELNQMIDMKKDFSILRDFVRGEIAEEQIMQEQIKKLLEAYDSSTGHINVACCRAETQGAGLLARIDELEAQLASGQEPVAWHENIKNLCDQYAQECVQFALGIKAGSGSMSPIASRAGDTRLALHTAIDCAKPKSPAQQPLSNMQKQRIHNETGAGHALISLVEMYIKERT